MASKTGAKGQKIGRKRTRSPSHKNYNASRRDLVNKLRKLRAHCKALPNDQRAASALTRIEKGEHGPAGTFPLSRHVPDKHVPDGVNPIEIEYRKHHIEYKRKDGKQQRIVILEETVCTQPVYQVVGDGVVTQEATQLMSDAFRFYTESHGAVTLVERTGDLCRVLKNKKAAPPKGFENQFRKAYGNVQ